MWRGGRNMRILLVDDEKPIRDLRVPFWKDLKHQVESAATVTEGLGKAATFKPDTVLLDVNLPDGNGLDFLKKLRTFHPDASVVMITANVDVKTAAEAIKQGAEDYLAKPLDLDELEVILKQLVERRGLKRDVVALKGHQKELYRKD